MTSVMELYPVEDLFPESEEEDMDEEGPFYDHFLHESDLMDKVASVVVMLRDYCENNGVPAFEDADLSIKFTEFMTHPEWVPSFVDPRWVKDYQRDIKNMFDIIVYFLGEDAGVVTLSQFEKFVWNNRAK